MKTIWNIALVSILALGIAQGQNRTRFAGRYNAWDYAYGIQPGVTALQLATGNATTGSATITLVSAWTTLSDGTRVFPVTTTTPILVGVGTTQDSVTPTSVSSCNYDAGYATCQVTASFTYTHGTGELVTTGSYGIQEAINAANGNGGGTVVVDRNWANNGGTTAKITGATAYSSVAIEDTRSGDTYWSMQPTTLTSLAVPTTLTGTTVVFAAAPVGTWANSAYYFCVSYVDALGGEGPCSLTYNQTPTLNYSVTVTSPAASTGAVGWRLYAGASYNAAYLMPITSTQCTLTTLESVMPACAIGSNGVWLAPPLTTTTLRPNATVSAGALSSPTVNISATQPQGHTTFGYQPSGTTLPQVFQTHYGPFPAFGSLTAGQIAPLGSINLPTGFLNYIGRTVRLRGKITTGSVNTATLPTLNAQLDWVGGTTAGVGVNVCSLEGVAVGATKVYQVSFQCEINTNAVGATAVGSVMPDGYALLQAQDISANGLFYVDTNTAAVGSLGLFAQDTISIVYTSTTNTTAAPQLISLDVDVLQ